MRSYNFCDGVSIIILLFITLIFGLYTNAETKDVPESNIAADKNSTSILLSSLVDASYLNNTKYKRNTNTSTNSTNDLEARALQNPPVPKELDEQVMVNETKVNDSEQLEAPDSFKLANKDVKTAIKINNATPRNSSIAQETVTTPPKAVKPISDSNSIKPVTDKWVDKQLTADHFFPGEFSDDMEPRALEPKEPQIDRILNKIETDLQLALHNAMKELYTYVLYSVTKGNGIRNKQLLETDLQNLEQRLLSSASITESPKNRSTIDSKEIDLPKILKKLSRGEIDLPKILKILSTGEIDLPKILKSLSTAEIDLPKILKNLSKEEIDLVFKILKTLLKGKTDLDSITAKTLQSDKGAQTQSDFLSLMNQPRNELTGSTMNISNSANKLDSSYFSDSDLTDLFKILNLSKSYSADTNKYPIIMYLVNINPDSIEYLKPNQFPTYPNFTPNVNFQPINFSGNFLPGNKLQPQGIMCSHPTNCPNPEMLKQPFSMPQSNLRSHPLNTQLKRLGETTVKDFYKFLPNLGSYWPNTAKDKLYVPDDSKNLLVKFLHDTIPFKGHEFDVIPHFKTEVKELEERKQPNKDNILVNKEIICRCLSLPVRYISNLLKHLELKPVTKSEFLQYLINLIQIVKSDNTTLFEGIFNEVSVPEGSCNCPT